MENEKESLLDQIAQAPNLYIYCEDWANGMVGAISDHSGHSVYRFYEMRKGDRSYRHIKEKTEDNPIVATGIIGYWLHYRHTDNRLTSAFGPVQNTPLKYIEIFEAYTKDKFSQYKDFYEKKDPSSWRRNLELEFYNNFVIPNETKLNKQTEALFAYITPDDCSLVQAVMNEYIKFLEKLRSAVKENMDYELIVLQHLASAPDDIKPKSLEEWEFNATCDSLERQGYIRVAWVSGHRAEDVMLLDTGRMRLRQLERREMKEDGEIERLRKENAELKEQIAQLTAAGNLPYDKNKAMKDLLPYFKGRTSDVNDFLEQVTGLRPKQITTTVNNYIDSKIIVTDGFSSRSFHNVLYKHHIYDKQYSTWSSQVNWKEKKKKK